MTYKLTATVSHKAFDKPITHTYFYTGDTKAAILDQIDTLPHHLENLDKHGRTAFKDTRGVKHSWRLEHMTEMN